MARWQEKRIRVWAYVVALIAGLFSVGAAAPALRDDAVNLFPIAAVLLTGLLAWLQPRRARDTAALGAGLVAIWTPGLPPVGPAVGVLVFVSVLADTDDVPWRGWAGGLAGASLSLVFHVDGTVAPFVWTCAGGLLGLLLRTRTRTEQLEGEAERLRGQARWLEQRTSVARELHDVVGHHVTAMVVQSEAGQLGNPQKALQTIGDLGRTALQELDSLVVHLRDPQAPLTVSAPPRLLDIDELLAQPLRAASVRVTVDVADDLHLNELDVLTVYRVAQEGLTNVARHARARHAWVELTRRDDVVRVRVSDDGVGPPLERDRGSGLVGIEERVAARGGRAQLVRRPGGGTILDVTLPVGPRAS